MRRLVLYLHARAVKSGAHASVSATLFDAREPASWIKPSVITALQRAQFLFGAHLNVWEVVGTLFCAEHKGCVMRNLNNLDLNLSFLT